MWRVRHERLPRCRLGVHSHIRDAAHQARPRCLLLRRGTWVRWHPYPNRGSEEQLPCGYLPSR
ncbi:hypothetical protein JIQ42_02812 [Leishmania sp. Namibia]|uniref:hypothetical protein n=1 Tax=Leishmania sp. Namibia TaxID=2802991 RepID=UPI001B3EE000|nr:hypothetical protein JIQ42_02812 [Leishmania sp. Namibia]